MNRPITGTPALIILLHVEGDHSLFQGEVGGVFEKEFIVTHGDGLVKFHVLYQNMFYMFERVGTFHFFPALEGELYLDIVARVRDQINALAEENRRVVEAGKPKPRKEKAWKSYI